MFGAGWLSRRGAPAAARGALPRKRGESRMVAWTPTEGKATPQPMSFSSARDFPITA